jgi:hypothetical protein
MIGNMILKRRQERSYNGVGLSVLKSGMQKYVRRGLLDKGLWCLVEMDLFRLIEATPEGLAAYLGRSGTSATDRDRRAAIQKAKAIRTNMVNRLIVMVSEEISIAAWWLPLVVHERVQAWNRNRGQAAALGHLFDVYKYLCAARKIRLISDLKSVYLLPPDYVDPDERGDLQSLHADLLRSLGAAWHLEDRELVREQLIDACRVPLAPFLPEDSESRQIVNGLLVGMKHHSDQAFHWLGRLIDRHRDEEGRPRFGGKKDPLRVVWRLLAGFAEQREGVWGEPANPYPEAFRRVGEVIAVLQHWYETLTHRERPIYLYHALLLILRRREIDWESRPPGIDTPPSEVQERSNNNLTNGPLELDPFVFDIHTEAQGPGGLTRFALEGARVEQEEVRFRNELYRSIYVGLKERLDAYYRTGVKHRAQRSGETA